MLAVTRMDRVRNDQLTGTVKVELFGDREGREAKFKLDNGC